jgi:hypothetical protein
MAIGFDACFRRHVISSMIRNGNRFSSRPPRNAFALEVMFKQRDEITIQFNPIGS